jgi:magnesium transporter
MLTVRIMAYDPGAIEETTLDAEAILAAADPAATLAEAIEPWVRDARRAWIEIDTDRRDLVARAIGQVIPLHPIVTDVLVQRDHRPAIDRFPGLIHAILDLAHARKTLSFEKVDVLAGEGWIIGVGSHPDEIFEPVRRRLRRGDALRSLGTPFLLHALVEAMCRHDSRILDRLGERMETLELSLIDDPSPARLNRIHALKRDLRGLRRSVVPLMESATTFLSNRSGPEHAPSEDLDMAVREIHDELASVADILDAYRDAAQNLAELYATSLSNRLNEILRTLAIISTVFIPLNFIAALFGMNFSHLPLTEDPLGFWVTMGVMVVLAAAVVAVAWRQGWLKRPSPRGRAPAITRNQRFDEKDGGTPG